MSKASYIKVDGVCLNIDWVKGMTLTQFKKNEQINSLFKRVPDDKKADVLSTVYQTITGKKGQSGGNEAPTTVNDTAIAPAMEQDGGVLANG